MDTIHGRSVPAGQFKQHCLSILDEVALSHDTVTVTKRGRPVARIVPVEQDDEIEARILDGLRSGGARMLVDVAEFVAPTNELAGWNHQ